MGKGDIRSRRGKIFRGTFGKTRKRKKKQVKESNKKEIKAEEKNEEVDQ